MAPFSFGRLGRAIGDVLNPIEKVHGTIKKTPTVINIILEAALVSGGVWVAWEWKVMLPELLLGQLLLLGLFLGVLALGVSAAYRHRAQSEDTERNERRRARREAWAALAEVLSHILNLTSLPFNESLLAEALPELKEAIRRYGEAGRKTHELEIMNHLMLERNLRAALSLGTPLQIRLGLSPVLTQALQIYAEQSALFAPLDADERKVLHQTMIRISRMTMESIDAALDRIKLFPD